MKKDLIIGNASNYTWDDLKYWVNSIRMCDFQGDVILTGTNMDRDTIEKLTDYGVQLHLHGREDEKGNIVSEEKGVPHVDRFFYIWNVMNNLKDEYRYVITTDTRDVVFQRNPIEFIEDIKIISNDYDLIASSEGMTYKDEPWGNSNLYQALGPFFHNKMKDKLIYNVGVIGGGFNDVKSLMLMIFQLSLNRPIAIVDQAVYNFILDIPIIKEKTFFASNYHSWAIQLGTTEEAVKAGSGDLGIQYRQNPSVYDNLYKDHQPEFLEDIVVCASSSVPYYIVHQYDRIPDLKAKIHAKYGDIDVA